MGPRNLLILFFSTVAVSLVILIIFFSLFFKNVDLNFNTRLPESAPDIGHQYANVPSMNPDSKADGVMRATVNVPPESQEPSPGTTNAKKKSDSDAASDSDLPPVTDDSMLEHDNTAPITDPGMDSDIPGNNATGTIAPDKNTTSRTTTPAPAPRAPRPSRRQVETPPPPAPMATPQPAVEESTPDNSGPPVPGQN